MAAVKASAVDVLMRATIEWGVATSDFDCG